MKDWSAAQLGGPGLDLTKDSRTSGWLRTPDWPMRSHFARGTAGLLGIDFSQKEDTIDSTGRKFQAQGTWREWCHCKVHCHFPGLLPAIPQAMTIECSLDSAWAWIIRQAGDHCRFSLAVSPLDALLTIFRGPGPGRIDASAATRRFRPAPASSPSKNSPSSFLPSYHSTTSIICHCIVAPTWQGSTTRLQTATFQTQPRALIRHMYSSSNASGHHPPLKLLRIQRRPYMNHSRSIGWSSARIAIRVHVERRPKATTTVACLVRSRRVSSTFLCLAKHPENIKNGRSNTSRIPLQPWLPSTFVGWVPS